MRPPKHPGGQESPETGSNKCKPQACWWDRMPIVFLVFLTRFANGRFPEVWV